MKLFFNQVSVSKTDRTAKYPAKEFASPTRSTVPLLDALRQYPTPVFFNKLLLEAGMDIALADLHLEYQVKPPTGRGKPSHTDLMAIQLGPPKRSLAIEAKWTEPRYETVATWLRGGTSPENRREVLRGWLGQITTHTKSEIHPDHCGGLVYQMVHRAASAVAASGSGGHPAMAYLIFQQESEGRVGAESQLEGYRNDLRQFRKIVGNQERFPFFLVSVLIRPTGAFEPLSALPKGSTDTGRAVRMALEAEGVPLFDFGDGRIEPF